MDIRLKEILEEKGISLTTLAEKTGIEKGNLSSIANNKKNPTIETLQKISNSLDIPIWQLFVNSRDENNYTLICQKENIFYNAKNIDEIQTIINTIKKSDN
jgi:transcriptional regulator with XRE-family HTH domain